MHETFSNEGMHVLQVHGYLVGKLHGNNDTMDLCVVFCRYLSSYRLRLVIIFY